MSITHETKLSVLLISLVALSVVYSPSANARGFLAAGPRGIAGGRVISGANGTVGHLGVAAFGQGAARISGSNLTGANGGTFKGIHGAAIGANGALRGGAFSATGANGGSASGGRLGGWQNGSGGFRSTALNVAGPGGSSYSGATTRTYNAQSQSGSLNQSRQVVDAQNGQDYGYTKDRTYTKGQGFDTTVNTDNHGSYNLQRQPQQ